MSYGHYSDTPRPYRTAGDSVSGARENSGKRCKTVFDNGMLTHVWAQDKQDAGRTNNGNMCFKDGVLYSYNTAIAAIVRAPDGRKYALITSQKYSVSTSQHISAAWGSIGYKIENMRELGIEAIFHVPYIVAGYNGGWGDTCQGDVHAANRDAMLQAIHTMLDARMTARLGSPNWARGQGTHDSTLELANEMHGRVIAYCAAFGKKLYTKAQAKKQSAAIASRCAEIEARFKELQAKRETPAYLANVAKKVAEKEAAMQIHRAHSKAQVEAWIAKDGWPNHISQVYMGWDDNAPSSMHMKGAAKYKTLEGEELHAAREKWFADQIETRAKHDYDSSRANENKRKKAIADAKKNAANIAKWKAGENVAHPALDEHGGAYFRVVGAELQSSMGARVPLDHAIRVFKFVRLIREKYIGELSAETARATQAWQANGRTLKVGMFQVSRVYADGSFIAGCHTVYWPAIEEAAALAGVLSEAAADTTEDSGHDH